MDIKSGKNVQGVTLCDQEELDFIWKNRDQCLPHVRDWLEKNMK